MSYTYDHRKRSGSIGENEPQRTSAPGPDLSALMTGTARPSAAQKGRPIDLDAAMKARMEHAFGDLSAVKLYESPIVGQAGAEAMAMGNEIAFAPGMADFSSRAGQERLGHELSHVMSQRTGAVRGEGFLASSALEARADREGAMAAAGEQVYTGPVTSALSGGSPSPSIAGPMQAKRRDADARNVKNMQAEGESFNGVYATPDYEGYGDLNENEWETKVHAPSLSKLWGKKKQTYKVRRSGKGSKFGMTADLSKIDRQKDLTIDNDTENQRSRSAENKYRKGMRSLEKKLSARYQDETIYDPSAYFADISRPANPIIEGVNDNDEPDTPVKFSGMGPNRTFPELATDRGRGFKMSENEIIEFFDGLMAPHKKNLSPKDQLEANKQFDKSIRTYKNILYGDLKHLEKTYGRLLGQMHPEDIAPQMGTGQEFRDHFRFSQDSAMLIQDGGRYFDYENNQDDKHFKDLDQYYGGALNLNTNYQNAVYDPLQRDDYTPAELNQALEEMKEPGQMQEVEDKIGGPRMSPKRYQAYLADLKEREEKEKYMKGRLFGKFK